MNTFDTQSDKYLHGIKNAIICLLIMIFMGMVLIGLLLLRLEPEKEDNCKKQDEQVFYMPDGSKRMVTVTLCYDDSIYDLSK